VSSPLFEGFLTNPCAEPTQGLNISVLALKSYSPFQLITHTHTESGYFEVSNPAQSFTPLNCVLPAGIDLPASKPQEDRPRAGKANNTNLQNNFFYNVVPEILFAFESKQH
jgi:hypothetical protein